MSRPFNVWILGKCGPRLFFLEYWWDVQMFMEMQYPLTWKNDYPNIPWSKTYVPDWKDKKLGQVPNSPCLEAHLLDFVGQIHSIPNGRLPFFPYAVSKNLSWKLVRYLVGCGWPVVRGSSPTFRSASSTRRLPACGISVKTLRWVRQGKTWEIIWMLDRCIWGFRKNVGTSKSSMLVGFFLTIHFGDTIYTPFMETPYIYTYIQFSVQCVF